jgi:fatty acid desaturase
VDPPVLRRLQTRSDLRGLLQALGYLSLLVVTASLVLHSAGRWPWWCTGLLLWLHGTCYAFQINAVHELMHGTVFRTATMNAIFLRIFAFLGWINFPLFAASHARHHQFTLHPPDDLEVVLPYRFGLKEWLLAGFIDPSYLIRMLREALRLSHGRFEGEWELALFPLEDRERRRGPVRWARVLLAGHAAILVGAILAASVGFPRALLLPLLITFGKCYGGWLFMACNHTQHIGLQTDTPDYRRSCRTFTLNPVARFLYWNMNFHIDHHMFTQVPCYRLPALHAVIRHDLPPASRGLLATWREISAQGCRRP